jgi:hypothetical protein
MVEFSNSLQQFHGDNLWPMQLTIQNDKARVQRQCDYLLGIQNIGTHILFDNIFLQRKWPKNKVDSKMLLTSHPYL